MKILKSLTIIALFLVSMSTFSQDKKANNIDNSNIALQGYSPVSYLDLNLAQRGNKNYKSTHEGVVYYFTSTEQKASFDKNPKKYLPQYGGYCAFGTYAGAKFRVDPNKFLVHNGKYYLFLNNVELDAKQLWLKENNNKKLVKVANTNWKKLKNTYN
ncbi:YHS domain-containing (seleno)protein [Tenacibaculum agarivorans]|uniref:YHS domain-containing (seleno)protein n=1 Tax=Tenacibaculum agarivorans TaxID=1908389 RepID=UPI00094BC09C|nr:YHS domain-containing (seleno)protein [Tenacibaculum agarivorans]